MRAPNPRILAGGLVGLVLAVVLGLVSLPRITAGPDRVEAVRMEGLARRQVRTYGTGDVAQQVVAPPPVPQVVPRPLTEGEASMRDMVETRADWVGGAVVVCQLPGMEGASGQAQVDGARGFTLDGPVDVTSRMFTMVHDGRVELVVKEPVGEVTVHVSLSEGLVPSGQPAPGEAADSPAPPSLGRAYRVRWSSAAEGTTVGCDGAWEVPSALLAVSFRTASGRLLVPDEDGLVRWPGPAILQGCGHLVPLFDSQQIVSLDVEARPCRLRVQLRNPDQPLALAYGEPATVHPVPGTTTEVLLDLPPVPPVYAPPDLVELTAAADIAASYGYNVAADALDDLIGLVLDGEWDPDLAEQMARTLAEEAARQSAGEGGQELQDAGTLGGLDDLEAGVDSEDVEELDAWMTADPELVEAFADDVEAGADLSTFPPETRAAIEAELERREGG